MAKGGSTAARSFGVREFAPAIVILIVGIIIVGFSGSMFEKVDAGELVIIQDPIDGDLHFFVEAGLKWQGFGKPTHYRKSFQYWFSELSDQGARLNQSIKVRFNDGGHANVSGSVRADLPLDQKFLREAHVRYGSQHAIEQEMVRTVIEKAVYMTGPLMSSKESYADRRNDLINFIEDQAAKGVYRTVPREVKGFDPMTGKEKTATVVEILVDSLSMEPMRQEQSPLEKFGIKLYNLSINSIKYDERVETQIDAQQQAIMEVQTAMAEAKKAEQRAITAEKEGQAKAAQAKWAQEVLKATAVVEAQQKLEVAELDRQAAEQQKQREILLGQGEATRKQLVMEADGALKQKLDAWVQVNKYYSEAISKYQGNWVPQIITGGSGNGQAASGADQLIDLLTTKTARDLSLELNIAKGTQ